MKNIGLLLLNFRYNFLIKFFIHTYFKHFKMKLIKIKEILQKTMK